MVFGRKGISYSNIFGIINVENPRAADTSTSDRPAMAVHSLISNNHLNHLCILPPLINDNIFTVAEHLHPTRTVGSHHPLHNASGAIWPVPFRKVHDLD